MNKRTSASGRVFKILGAEVKRSPLIAVFMSLAIIFAIIAGVLPPLVLERVVNDLTEGLLPAVGTVALYLALLIISGLLDSGREVLITLFGQRVMRSLRAAMEKKLALVPADYFVSNDAGSVSSLFVNDVNAVDSLFTSGIISMIADAGKMLCVLAVVYTRSIGLGILITLVLPLIFLLTMDFQRRTLTAQTENRKAIGELSGIIPETIINIRSIRLMHAQRFFTANYGKAIEKSFAAQEKSNFCDSVYSPIIIFTSAIMVAIMMTGAASSGGFRTLFGISAGSAVALISFVTKIFAPMEGIGMEIQNIQSALAGLRRINEFLSEDEMEEAENCFNDDSADLVKVNSLSFSYPGDDRRIFNNYSLSVSKGEHVTIAGRTGAGKSTLFKLLLGLYEPDEGSISIFGSSPRAIPEDDKRSLYGYVEQHFHPVPGTVGEQISLRDRSVTTSQIEKSLILAGLWQMVSELPMGIDTPYRDSLFSQGQLQLLSIARAVVKEPKLLLLDEITANLDSATEKQVMDALERASTSRTVISISHRTAAQSGRIINITGDSI